MKKKFIILVAASLMAMLLAACSNTDGAATPTVTEKPTEVPATPTVEPTATSTPTPEPTATPVPEVTDTYVKGVVTEDSFVSKWMNLRFTKQAGMTMASQEELDEVMKQGAELLYGENADLGLLYSKLTTVTEMMAQYANGANVLIQVELLPTMYAEMTEEEYIFTVISNITNNAAGLTITTDETVYEAEIGGETYKGITVVMDYGNGFQVTQDYLVRKKESRMIVIAVSYTEVSVEEAATLMKAFGSYDSEPIILPTVVPTVTPTESPAEPTTAQEGFDEGAWNGSTYENAWLGFRFTAPAGASIQDDNMAGGVSIEVTWEQGLPIVQMMTEEAMYENMTAEEYAAALELALKSMAAEGITYTFEEELYSIEIAGQEYINLAAVADVGIGVPLYQEYCLREQDGYMVVLIFTYADGYEEVLQEVFDAFVIY